MFINETRSRIVKIHINSKIDNTFKVEVFLRTVNIAEKMIKNNLAIRDSKPVYEVFPKLYSKSLDDEISITAIVTCIYSPYCFYVQEISEGFPELEENIQKTYSNDLKALKDPQVGMICVAKYNEDQAWYRATIKEIDHDQRIIKVFFVDYGNEDVLSMDDETINICEIKDEFKKFPAMAIKCSLHAIEPTVDCKYGSNEIVDFMFLEMNSSVLVKFIDFYEDFYYVDISYEKVTDDTSKMVNIKDYLIEKNMAQLIQMTSKSNYKPINVHNEYLKIAINDKINDLSDMNKLMSNKFLLDSAKFRNS